MNIGGRVWKSRKDKFWLAEVPFLDLMVQAVSKDEIPATVAEAIELLVDHPTFACEVTMVGNTLLVESNDSKRLMAVILKKQRLRKNLKLEEVAGHLRAKSINEYAQYEQGKHLASFEKFEQLLRAIDPVLMPIVGMFNATKYRGN